MRKKEKITKEMTIAQVLKKYPKTIFVFLDYGLHCLGCPMIGNETIEEAANFHQIDLNKFLKDLNKKI
jgi:hybrid cluster-associated redox disulfide protein